MLRRPKLIVWDECAHIAAQSWAKIHSEFPEAFHIGLTATPLRLDGKGLGEYFDKIVKGPSVSWLINNGFLAKYRLFSPPGINTDGIHITMGDFDKKEVEAASDKPTITGDAIKHYLKHAKGKRTLAFCCSIAHSKHVVDQFIKAGIPAAHVDGETEVYERDRKIRSFERGEILILSNVDLFIEGLNVTSAVGAILLRPTKSLSIFLQSCGRVLRPDPEKEEAIILDHCGLVQKHGLPDEEREWTLDAKNGGQHGKGDQSKNISVRICPSCFAAQASRKTICTFCGFTFEIESRKVAEVEGDLQEVDLETIRRNRNREQGQAQTVEDLAKIGISRGYKSPWKWAHFVFQARQAKRLAQGRV